MAKSVSPGATTYGWSRPEATGNVADAGETADDVERGMVAGCGKPVAAGGARVATPEGCDGRAAEVGDVIVVEFRALLVSDRTATPDVADVSGCGGSDPASNGRGSRIGEVVAGIDVAEVAVVGLMLGVAKRPSSTTRDVVGGSEATLPFEVVARGIDAAAGGLAVVVGIVERSGFAEVDAAAVEVVGEVVPVVNGGGALKAEGWRGVDEADGEA